MNKSLEQTRKEDKEEGEEWGTKKRANVESIYMS